MQLRAHIKTLALAAIVVAALAAPLAQARGIHPDDRPAIRGAAPTTSQKPPAGCRGAVERALKAKKAQAKKAEAKAKRPLPHGV